MRTRRRSTQPGGSGNRSTSSPPSAAPAVAASAAAERGVEGDDPSTIQRDFAASVWRLVTRIPHGRVTTYGHIAKQLGYPRHARMVGQSLKMLPPHRASPLLEDGTTSNPDFVPWHRVVNAKGDISPRGNVGATARQADMLQAEGVTHTMTSTDSLHPIGHIRLSEYGWFP